MPFVFGVTIVCSLVVVYRRVGGMYYLYLPGQQPLCTEAVAYFLTFVTIAGGDSAGSVLCLETPECSDRAVVQVGSRGSVTAEVRDRSQVCLCEICSGQSDTGAGFSPSASDFPGHLSFVYHLRRIILAVDSVVK
jgi:hypothetical protein